MNHQIYGVILFAFILILIYLLNRINSNSNEGFENAIETNFNIYDNMYFNIDKELKNMSLENALIKCVNNSDCIGITKHKTKNIFYEINNLDICKTQYQGSDLEKDASKNYITYIKKQAGNGLSCVSDNSMDKIISIQTNNSKTWVVRNNKIELSSIAKIDGSNEFNLTKFKLVKGLHGINTVSIKFEINGFSNVYVVNEYPKNPYLSVKEIKENQTELKKNASFKIVNGFTKSGFSIKIVGFPNIFVNGMDNSIITSMVEEEEMQQSTFYIKPELSSEYVKINDMESDTQRERTDSNDLGLQEKIKKMRTKNLYVLEKQSNLLDNQNNMINNYNFIQGTNIGNIGREFANQSANLALTKYLEEKNEIDRIKNNNNS